LFFHHFVIFGIQSLQGIGEKMAEYIIDLREETPLKSVSIYIKNIYNTDIELSIMLLVMLWFWHFVVKWFGEDRPLHQAGMLKHASLTEIFLLKTVNKNSNLYHFWQAHNLFTKAAKKLFEEKAEDSILSWSPLSVFFFYRLTSSAIFIPFNLLPPYHCCK